MAGGGGNNEEFRDPGSNCGARGVHGCGTVANLGKGNEGGAGQNSMVSPTHRQFKIGMKHLVIWPQTNVRNH